MCYLCSEIKDRYMKYTILQLDSHNPDVVKDRKLFEPWNILNRHSKFDISQYKKVYEGEVPDVTKVHVLRQGEKVALLATGYEVQQVLKAADILKEQGINATVVDIACIKPIDEEGVIDILKNHEHVFTVEEHSIVGGFGSAVCEVACNKYPHIIHRIGVNDIFGESGPAMAVITKYGLDGESIARKVLETVK